MSFLQVPAANSPEALRALERGLRALQDALRVGGDPHAPSPVLLDALERWWAAYDDYLAVVAATLPVRCTAGCSACCRDNPRGISGVELWWILRSGVDSEKVAASAERFAQRLEGQTMEAAQAATKKAVDPCPLLGEDGRCTVYAARPVACRMFYALTDPAWCDHRHARMGEAVNPHLVPPEILRKILVAISERLGLAGLPPDLRRGLAAAAHRLDQRPAT